MEILQIISLGTMETKVCNKCNEELPITSFCRHSGSNYYRPECKQCNNKLSRIRRALKKKHGDPPEDYICPICHRTAEEVKGKGGEKCSTWVIDHDHETNEFRGWLCHCCNRGVGCFHDSILILNRAINYLTKPPK